MKESTRRKVLQAAEQLNYQPNAVASSFASGKSRNIGVVLPHVPKVHLFSTYYFSEILSGIGEAVRTREYGLLLLYRDPGRAYDYVALFRAMRADACLILGASSLPQEEEAIARLAAERLPFCLVDHRSDNPLVSSVTADHAEGNYRAAKHLLDSGHRRIGFLNGSPQYSNSRDRLAGYRRALEEAGVPYDPGRIYEGNYSRTSGYAAADAIYRDLDRLDAVLCGNDRMAIGLIQGLRDKGCPVPQRLPVVGYDNSDAARLTDPPLTTVEVPFYEMGRLAAEKLLAVLTNRPDAEAVFREVLPTRLIVRQSCGSQPSFGGRSDDKKK